MWMPRSGHRKDKNMKERKVISHKDRMAAKARHEEAAEWKPAEDDTKQATEQQFCVSDAEQAAA